MTTNRTRRTNPSSATLLSLSAVCLCAASILACSGSSERDPDANKAQGGASGQQVDGKGGDEGALTGGQGGGGGSASGQGGEGPVPTTGGSGGWAGAAGSEAGAAGSGGWAGAAGSVGSCGPMEPENPPVPVGVIASQSQVATALQACNASPMQIVAVSTAEALAEFVTGTWVQCPVPDATGLSPEIAGLEFRASGRVSLLVLAPDGSLGRRSGVDYSGTWCAPIPGDSSGRVGMVLAFDSNPYGMWQLHPEMTSQPTQLRIGDMLGWYVRVGE